MIPLADDNPHRTLPVVTVLLIALCGLAFLWQLQGPWGFEASVGLLGFIPVRLLGDMSVYADAGDFPTEAWATLLTSMFLHGSVAHIGGNMLYLWVFGDNLEAVLGRVPFVLFYLLCGVLAALTEGILAPQSEIPMVGASGAISGVLGAYLVLFPRQRVTVALPYVGITELPALVVLGMWFVYQFVYALAEAQSGASAGIAFGAHLGGFIAGAVLVWFFGPNLRRGPKLWE